MPWPLYVEQTKNCSRQTLPNVPQVARLPWLETTGVESVLVWTTVTKYHRLRTLKAEFISHSSWGWEVQDGAIGRWDHSHSLMRACVLIHSHTSSSYVVTWWKGQGNTMGFPQLCPHELITTQRSYLQIQSLWEVRGRHSNLQWGHKHSVQQRVRWNPVRLCSSQIHGILIETGQPQLLMTDCQLYPVLSSGWIRGTWFVLWFVGFLG